MKYINIFDRLLEVYRFWRKCIANIYSFIVFVFHIYSSSVITWLDVGMRDNAIKSMPSIIHHVVRDLYDMIVCGRFFFGPLQKVKLASTGVSSPFCIKFDLGSTTYYYYYKKKSFLFLLFILNKSTKVKSKCLWRKFFFFLI